MKNMYEDEELNINEQSEEQELDFNELQNKNEEEAKKIKIRDDMVKLIKIYYKEDNVYLLERIVSEFEPLMYKLAQPYRFTSCIRSGRLELKDFIQEARLKLVEVLKNRAYDPKKSSPLTYFFTIIKNRYYSLMMNNNSAFKYSETAKNKLLSIQKYNELIKNGMRESTALKKAGLTKKDLLKWKYKPCISLDNLMLASSDSDHNTDIVEDFIIDKNQESQDDTLIKREFYNLLHSKLTDEEYEILSKNAVDNLSLREIAEEKGVTEYDIRKVLNKAVKKMQECDEINLYRDAFNKE